MTTETITFSGTAEWAHVRKPDDAFGTKAYKITVDLDKDSINRFNASGLQLEPKENGGAFKVTFRRDTQRLGPNGEVEEYGPPSIFAADGKTRLAEEVLIGNGSKVAVKVEVFDTRKGKGHRLRAIRVDDLIKYEQGSAPNEF